MNDEKLLEIAEKLLERTRAGRIVWSETVDSNTYTAAFPDYSVTIAYIQPTMVNAGTTSFDGYIFSVFNENGTEVESTRYGGGKGAETILGALYESARSRALNSDEILDDLLTRLSGDG